MPDTFTPNVNLTKPEVGASRDAWGGKWNDNADKLDTAIKAVQDKPGVPAGMVMYYPLATPPDGWLKCNGAAISRTTYATLFTLIGTTWGAGDGSTTFNLPDFRGEFLRVWDDGRGVDPGRGSGSSQGQNAPDHKHETNMGYTSGQMLQWTNDWPHGSRGLSQQITRGRASMINEISQSTLISFTSPMIAADGSENRPRNVALLACIKY